MVAFTAGAVLTAANLNSAFNALTIRTVTGTSDTLVLADNGGAVTYSNASPVSVTVPLFSSIAYATGTKIVLVNLGAGKVTVAGAGGVTVNGSPLTLAQNAGATLIKTATNTWSFLPFSSGVGAANFSDAATGTYTGYKYKTYTASGTLTIDKAGFADILVIGGGGSGAEGNVNYGGGGGGAGGYLAITNAYLIAGTLTVTVGAGGAPSTALGTYATPGNPSRLGDYYAVGGAPGMTPVTGGATFMAFVGGSGFGGTGGETATRTGGTGLSGQGNNGGDGFGTISGSTTAGGGGGGAGAVGQNASSNTGGNGGAGSSSSITGSAISRGGGGGGSGITGGSATDGGGAGSSGAGSNGTVNTGGGAGAGRGGDGGTGGSGVVIIRVAV